MDKVCLIYQPVGNGDQWWLMKVARHYLNQGFRVIWPVVAEYIWMQEYVPEIEWVSWDDKDNKLTHRDPLPEHVKFDHKADYNPYNPHILEGDFIYINGFLPPKSGVMEYKYESIGLSWEGWQNSVLFNRNKEKEDKLFQELGLGNEPYVFVNRNYQLRPHVCRYESIPVDPKVYGKRVVEMDIRDGYNLPDWLKVIESADEIQMIETSLSWILESPLVRDNLTKNLHLYSRHHNFWQVQKFFTLGWQYHT